MIVYMPVQCYGEKCINCPELDIDVHTKESFDIELIEEGRTAVKTSYYENALSCPHAARCKVIFDAANVGTPEETPKKKTPAKKTTTKTKKAAVKK